MSHTHIATSFLKLASSGLAEDAFDKYVHPDFFHHNQYFKGDRQSLKEAMKEAHQSNPNRAFDIKLTYEDGDTVITHSHVSKEDVEIAVVHIFRFRGDKIMEMWDLGQVIREDSPNINGPF